MNSWSVRACMQYFADEINLFLFLELILHHCQLQIKKTGEEMGSKGDVFLQVTVKKIDVVAPEVVAIQEHWLPQSNLDLLLPPIHPTSFYCYKKPSDEKYTYESMVSLLKKALAKTLVPFYPLAGEIVLNAFGEPEIFCNGRGVDFIEAYADIELSQLNLYNPDESIGGKFVPPLRRGVYAFQATQVKCGGIVVGCALDHRVTDGHSSQMFLQSWIEAAQGKPFSRIPSFRRSLLFALHSPRLQHRSLQLIKDLYVPSSALPPPKGIQPPEPNHVVAEEAAISRIYYIKAEEIRKLQSMANNNENNTLKKRSKFEAFAAFLWKALASSANNNSHDKICRLGIVVDGRSRLAAGDENKLASMLAYYGNVISIPFGEKQCEELKEKPLSWVADEVHDFLVAAATTEHFLGLLDFVESHRPEAVLAKIYATRVQEEGPAVVVSAGHQFPVAEMDFGWGPSIFASNYFPWGGQSGYVGTMPSTAGNGDWIVYMHLLKQQLDFLENHAAHVFNPLTSHYLNLS